MLPPFGTEERMSSGCCPVTRASGTPSPRIAQRRRISSEPTGSAEMTDAQRQYYLRQQLKAIQQELGEGEGNELADVRTRIEEAKLPESVGVSGGRKRIERPAAA